MSSDIVAVAIPTRRRVALEVSAYDLKLVKGQAASEGQLEEKLQMVRHAYDATKNERQSAQVNLPLCADFNRSCYGVGTGI